MSILSKYKIPLKGLKDGVHEFEFTINEEFFKHIEGAEEYKGEFEIKISFEKKTLVMPLKLTLQGYLNVACDRCLDNFDLSVKGENIIYVKFGEQEEADENIMIVPWEKNEIELTKHIYELFVLSLPLKIVHPDNEDGNSTCNKEMIQKIENLSIKKDEKIDDRWSELKKLSNK